MEIIIWLYNWLKNDSYKPTNSYLIIQRIIYI